MELVIYDSNLTAKDVSANPVQTACRAVVEDQGTILVVVETNRGITTLPGGRLEAGETPTECVLREVLEETGVIVSNPRETVRVIEHFEGQSFSTMYFRCDYVRTTTQTGLTAIEREMGLSAMWMDEWTLMDVLANPTSSHPFAEHIHNREFLGLIHSR